MEILVRVPTGESHFNLEYRPGRRPLLPNRRSVCTWPPSKTGNEKVGETVKEKVPEVKPAPGLSLRAQNPEDPAPSRRPGFQRSPRRPRRQSELGEERKRDGQ